MYQGARLVVGVNGDQRGWDVGVTVFQLNGGRTELPENTKCFSTKGVDTNQMAY